MIYDFICGECKERKEIDVPVSEYYIPMCCDKKMKRVYYVPALKAGALNRANVAN